MRELARGTRIVLMTPDKERGLTGVVVTPPRKVENAVLGRHETLVSVLLAGETRVAHYPVEFVEEAET